jgi:hypothetical protein
VRSPALLIILAIPSLLQAQSRSYPDLLTVWQRNRSTVLAYIDAMPDSATGFKPTPGVRTFAEQFDDQKPQPAIRLAALSFEHAVWTLGQVVPYLRLNGVTPPEYHMPF